MTEDTFSHNLQKKINRLKGRMQPICLGDVPFSSPLLLAPMASIGNAPFRLMMQELGAGGSVSELISCDGIVYNNAKTLKMLETLPKEKNLGIQIFGDDENLMARAAVRVQEEKINFIDINMGCPVKKVVGRGGGAALLREGPRLGHFFSTIKKAIEIPLSIKIRTGWCESEINADEIIHIAHSEGIEWVAVHGRTREQQYRGEANWGYLESLAENSNLSIIGNGDLHSHARARQKLAETKCHALMLGRGPLRNPFIFLESFRSAEEDFAPDFQFFGSDYFEVISFLKNQIENFFPNPRLQLIQLRKLIVWYSSGFKNATKFRSECYQALDMDSTMKITEDFFLSLEKEQKSLNYQETFMSSGHG